ncbi:hypothetical protein Hanom_Chr00s000003g01602371 [Helianthus anomalus]
MMMYIIMGGSPTSSSSPVSGRKRSSGKLRGGGGGFKVSDSETTYSVAPITMIEPLRFSVDVSYPTRIKPVHVFSQHRHHQQ